MGQVLHRSATTTEAVRRAIQHSQESLRALAKRDSVNPKGVAHAMQPVACLDSSAATESGDGDQVPADGDKGYPAPSWRLLVPTPR